VSWASEAVAAIRKMVLIEDRVERLTDQVKRIAESCQELDRRLIRLEAKFEVVEKVAATRRRSIRRKSET
jgi:ubiquinone biosynthesis protein UbiJ